MGNISSSGGNNRRRHGSRRNHPPAVAPHPEIAPYPFLFHGAAAAAPPPYPQQQQYQYPGYYPQMPPLPLHLQIAPNWPSHFYPYGPPTMTPPAPAPAPFVEHQKAVTIRNDVNIKKETIVISPDQQNPGFFLVSFTFDATVSGSITIFFFAKEGEDCTLIPMKENHIAPVTVQFQQGLAQKFSQPAGTGINFSIFEESDLLEVGGGDMMDVYPLAVKADASSSDETLTSSNTNCQITQAVFQKENGNLRVKVVKQILLVSGMRYELQEIYGIGNSMESEVDDDDDDDNQGKECVVCLTEPRNTIVHPCRHMCMCSECAKVLRFQTNRCPICRQPVERLLEIKVGSEKS